MLKRNLIIVAIVSLTLISAGMAVGQPRRRIESPNRSVYQKIEWQQLRRNRVSQIASPKSAAAQTTSRQPRSRRLTKTGAGTLNAAKNKVSRSSPNRISRVKTKSRIIMANTEGDFHLKAKTRRAKRN